MLFFMTTTTLRRSEFVAYFTAALVVSSVGLCASAQAADTVDETPPGDAGAVRFDVEVDPIAYVARGYSLHAGLSWLRLRLDLGAFGAHVPEFMHGQPGFEDRMQGYGAKLDVFLVDASGGPFLGVEGGWLEQRIVDTESHLSAGTNAWSAGVRAGWLFNLPGNFFVRPWVGVGYRFGELPVQVGERTFEQSHLLIFPTFHLGYRFD
jgi:opacity protein-like surface antigen